MFTKQKFTDWNLDSSILSGLEELGWEYATQVQKDTIPIARKGIDVIGQARTGSGKTGAFGIPIIESCQPTGKLQALILAPTRELANQVSNEITNIGGKSGLKIITVYGGTDLEKQARQLNDGVDIIVGTPGRVMDMSKRGHIDLASPSLFCLDEADRMLDMGFFPDIMWVIERMTSRMHTLLFSATFPQEIIDAANEFMNDPEYVLTNTEQLDVPPIELHSIDIGRANKGWALARILMQMQVDDQTMVFCNTKRMVDLCVKRLANAGFDIDGLHGDLNQNQRERILSKFKSGDIKTIIATDVAARGIDVDGITLVVNYDIPSDMDSFIHRIGRTGRIGRKGASWCLVSKDDSAQLARIIATYGLDITKSNVPELPKNVEKDAIQYKDDFQEKADVFGFVTLSVTIDSIQQISARKISNWISRTINCDELAIGKVEQKGDSVNVDLHFSKVPLLLKAVEKKDIEGNKVSATVA